MIRILDLGEILFQNQQKSEPNLDENEEQNELDHEINYLNLI